MPSAPETAELEEWNDYRSDPTERKRNALAEKYFRLCRGVAVGIWKRRGLPVCENLNDWIAECMVFMLRTAIPAYDPAKCKFRSFLYFGLSRRLSNRQESRQHTEDKRASVLIEAEVTYPSELEAEELEAKLRDMLGNDYIDGRLDGTLRRDGTKRTEKAKAGTRAVVFNRKLRNVLEHVA